MEVSVYATSMLKVISHFNFHFGDIECIYMEVYPPPTPYHICKIEELRKVCAYDCPMLVVLPIAHPDHHRGCVHRIAYH